MCNSYTCCSLPHLQNCSAISTANMQARKFKAGKLNLFPWKKILRDRSSSWNFFPWFYFSVSREKKTLIIWSQKKKVSISSFKFFFIFFWKIEKRKFSQSIFCLISLSRIETRREGAEKKRQSGSLLSSDTDGERMKNFTSLKLIRKIVHELFFVLAKAKKKIHLMMADTARRKMKIPKLQKIKLSQG